MKRVTTREITQIVGGRPWGGVEAVVENVSTDSRAIPENCLFIPLVGEHSDGHDYINKAMKAGAVAALFSRTPPVFWPQTYIEVKDTLLALKDLAKWHRDQFDIPVTAVTGSAGKTTTKEMIAAVLGRRLRTHRTAGNYNNHIGVPLTLLAMPEDAQAAVIEAGMDHFGEIRYLGEMIRPTTAVITNIGDSHIDNLGSREGILQAKSEIFESLQPGGTVILNGDDPLLRTLTLPFPIVYCGSGADCAYRFSEVEDRNIAGVDCTLTTPQGSCRLHIPAPGVHMAYAAAIAAAVGEQQGLTLEEIAQGVAAYAPTGRRMRTVALSGNRTLLDDCYNATPQSLAAALEILSKSEKTVAVLGDMFGLGDFTAQAHREAGALARRLGIGTIIAIGERARDLSGDHWFATVEEALPRLAALTAEEGTVILVKASHAMGFERISAALAGET